LGDTRISYPNNIFIIFNLGLSARIYTPYWFIMVFSALHNHNNKITATTTPLDLDPIAWRLNSAMWMDIDWDRWIELGQKKRALKWDTHVD
jgi:hypothetical protein